eukprot:CAMPEP_0206048512 /NCGR_PEP_ID=MMETSP1466-20131121/24307_1 /ASSEMBLY_ACC=CAM_ASM_001126 /TAXON_ID=44452 /ORGANISM="Pavlova gyrans, Strain CCMP608" /LENGTH=226 /DNA_ID=CAMNT_0053423573 /DNA_START=48 /DNA_END=724 /DNA_ORIENTATION=-
MDDWMQVKKAPLAATRAAAGAAGVQPTPTPAPAPTPAQPEAVRQEAERAVIANEFKATYYTMLRDKANQSQFFYYDESVVSRCDLRDLSNTPEAVGQTAINAKILSSGLAWSETTVLSLDHQDTPGGILVVAAGTVRCYREPFVRRFVQTFLLVKRDGSYFVRNDVHRVLDRAPRGHAVPGAMAEGMPPMPVPQAPQPLPQAMANGAPPQVPAVVQAVAASPQGPV